MSVRPRIGLAEIDLQFLALFDSILSTAVFDNCVHLLTCLRTRRLGEFRSLLPPPDARPDPATFANCRSCRTQRLDRQLHLVASLVRADQFQELRIGILGAQNLHGHLAFFFHRRDFLAFPIVQERGDLVVDSHRHAMDMGVLTGQHQQPNDLDRHAFFGLDDAASRAAGAVGKDAPFETGSDSLSRHFDQAERARAEDPRPCSIALHRIPEGTFHVAAMSFLPHVDEIVDDHAAQVAESQLAGDFAGGGLVQLVGGFFGRIVRAEVPAVDVDGDQGLGRIDDDRPASFKRDFAAMDVGDFLFEFVLVEERFAALVQFQAVRRAWA